MREMRANFPSLFFLSRSRSTRTVIAGGVVTWEEGTDPVVTNKAMIRIGEARRRRRVGTHSHHPLTHPNP